MKYNRTKNATRNIFFNLLMKIYNMVVPFLLRTLFIYIMGVQYMGLGSLFTSILSVLNLAELGVGSAMVYSMYKPLSEDDIDTVCALMNLYKKYYRIIGFVVLALGVLFCPILPYIIKDELPADINLYVLYFLNLASTVITYWLFAYKNCIINANQRNDITSKIQIIINALTSILQVIVLVVFRNYYLYLIVSIVMGLLSNIITAVVADKMFPHFQAKGQLPKKSISAINKRVRDLFTAKLGTVVVHSSDTIVISAFLGLTALTQYQNYYFIMTSVAGFIAIVYSSMTSIIGNSIVSETWEKNYRDFKILFFIISWISGICSACFLCLYQPFVELWMGKELLLDFGMVICFCTYFFASEINRVFLLYKDASGMWHSDKYRSLTISLLNLGLNIASVKYLGLYGIILSTITPMILVGYPWLVHNLSHEIFRPSKQKNIYMRLVAYVATTAISAIITYGICTLIHLPLIPTIIVRGILCLIIPNILFLLVYRNTADFQATLKFVHTNFLKNRFQKIIKLLERNTND